MITVLCWTADDHSTVLDCGVITVLCWTAEDHSTVLDFGVITVLCWTADVFYLSVLTSISKLNSLFVSCNQVISIKSKVKETFL
jgi:hypothetical protein